eukprot:s1725_g15.t1
MWKPRAQDHTSPGRQVMMRRWTDAVRAGKKGASAASSAATYAGAVPEGTDMVTGSAGPASGGAVPEAWPATGGEVVRTLQLRRGQCFIRTFGTLYTYLTNADLRIDLSMGAATLWTSTRGMDPLDTRDGRDLEFQEQLMSLPCYRDLLRKAENLLKPELLQNHTMRVSVESTFGRHRSVAFASMLALRLSQYSQVEVVHMEEWRWLPGVFAPRVEDWPARGRPLMIAIAPDR